MPAWLIGLTDLTIGIYVGTLVVTFPELLADRGVPEGTIATLTAAIAFSPSFWGFLLCPVLDVGFTYRTWATLGAVSSAVCLAVAMLVTGHLWLLGTLLLAGTFSAVFMANALGGWFSHVVPHEEKGSLSAWMTIANFAGNGIGAVTSRALVRNLPVELAAPAMAAVVAAPIALYPFIPVTRLSAPAVRRRFSVFFRDVTRALRRRDVLVALALFVPPTGAFALTNVLGGLGDGFHITSDAVSLTSGIAIPAGGIFGALVLGKLATRVRLIRLYLAVGIIGGCFTLILIVMPHVLATFALAVIGENAFEALALAATTAISFDVIGPNNPQSGTIYSVLAAASTFPVAYMAAIDGHGFEWKGLAGALGVDGAATIAACVILAILLRSRIRGPSEG